MLVKCSAVGLVGLCRFAFALLAGERDSLLRAVEGLERERDDLRGEAVRLGDVERHAAALALEHDQLARAHGEV